MTEGAHDPDKSALLRGGRRSRRRFRPFKALCQLFFLMLFGIGLCMALTLLVARTAGFRDLLARSVGKTMGTPVEIGGSVLGADMVLTLRDIRLPHPLPHAEGSIRELRLLPDWRRSRERRSLAYGGMELRDVTLHVMETKSGTREPAALMRPMGLDTWKNEVRGPPKAGVAGRLPKPAPPQAVPETRNERWRPWLFGMAECRFSIHNLHLVLHDEDGVEQAVFEEIRVEVEPGASGGDRLHRNARYRIDGKYQILANHMPSQDVHLEWMNEDGTWVLLRLEAERKLVFWVNRVLSGESAGPLAAREGPQETVGPEKTIPAIPARGISVMVGTNVVFQHETHENDPDEIKRILREFLDELPEATP